MTRKLSAMFLLSFVIVALLATSVFGATERVKPFHERVSIPARFAPVYGFPSEVAAATSDVDKGDTPMALGAKTISNPDTLGFTTYGYQQNCSMGRQVEHRGTAFIHFDWMWQTDDDITNTNRSIYYQAYDAVDCGTVFEFAAGGVDASLIGRAGYVDLDVDANQNLGIPVGHESDGQVYSPNAYWDFVATGEPFALFAPDAPADKFGWYINAGTGVGTSNESIWPKVAYQIGTDLVLHMVASESGGAAGDPSTIGYWRRVGGYGTESPTAVWSDQHVIDTTMSLNHTIAAEYTGDKVAIVWAAPVNYLQNTAQEFGNQYENDVWYAIASDQGAAWASTPTNGGNPSIANGVETALYGGGNITQYNQLSDYKAYCDISALFTEDNNLHIVWGCRQWTDTTALFLRSGAIFHWSEDNTTIRTIVTANWDTGGSCFGHAWGTDVAKMTISECINGANAGNLYVLFTQFGSLANPCGDVDSENQVLNGYLYLTASDDGGVNWDRAQRVTNTPETPTGCIPEDITDTSIIGTCNSEYWGSMARYSRTEACAGEHVGQEVLDIVYINDKAPGGCVQTESGVWTINPVIWWTTPCRDVVYEPLWSDNFGFGLGSCFGGSMIWMDPDGDTTLTFTATNPGLLVNNWTLTPTYTDGSGWMSVASTGGFALAPGGTSVDINITFTAPAGAANPSTWIGALELRQDAIGMDRDIPVCIVVADPRIAPTSAILATTCKRIKVWNNGELVNNEGDAALDYIDDCDTNNANTTSNIYLYDGGPIVTRIDGTDTLRFTPYSEDWLSKDGMAPLTPITVDSSGSDYSFATAKFATADTLVGMIVEYYVPKGASDCEFVIEKLKFFATTTPLTGVYVGEFLDWDVPSDTGSDNGSDFDLGRKLIYQYGAEYDDSGEAGCGQNSDDRFAGIAVVGDLKNAMTFDNATYVYSSGPYDNDAPLPNGVMYNLMSGEEGFSKYSTAVAESTYTDLSTLVTFGGYDLALSDTIEVCKILATSKTGLGDLQAAIDAGIAFIETHEICETDCCDLAGDANNDGALNIGDAVYLITHIFKSGPPPPCINEGDGNGDCALNVGDAVYLITHIFKSGPPPVCGCVE